MFLYLVLYLGLLHLLETFTLHFNPTFQGADKKSATSPNLPGLPSQETESPPFLKRWVGLPFTLLNKHQL